MVDGQFHYYVQSSVVNDPQQIWLPLSNGPQKKSGALPISKLVHLSSNILTAIKNQLSSTSLTNNETYRHQAEIEYLNMCLKTDT